MRVKALFILALILLLSPVAVMKTWAANCQTESPNLQASRSIWTPISTVDSSQLRGRILNFFGELEGHWTGAGGTTACVMSGTSAVPVQAPEQIRLTVTRNGQASFNFHFSIYDKRNNVSTSYDFMVHGQGSALQVTGEGNIAISEFYDGGIVFRTQTAMRTGFRRAYGKGTANTVLSLETVRQFVFENDELDFYKSVFHNGAIIDYSHWHFQRGS